MQGAPRGRPKKRPPGGRDPGSPHPASRAAAGHNPLRAGAEGTPVGLPTRGRGVSTVRRPENPAQGAAEGGARCKERGGGELSNGRRRGGAQPPPPTWRAAQLRTVNPPSVKGAKGTPRRSAHKGAGC